MGMPSRYATFEDASGQGKIYLQQMATTDASSSGKTGRWTQAGKKVWGVDEESDSAALTASEDEKCGVERYLAVAVTAVGSSVNFKLTLTGEAISTSGGVYL